MRLECRIVADVGNAVVHCAANFDAHDVSTVGQHGAAVGNFKVGGREAELAPAFVSVDDFARVSEISAEQFVCAVKVARRNQRPNPRTADGFPVDGERLTDFRLEAEILSLAQEHTPVTAPEASESVIRTRDDADGRNFIAQELQKFFGRFAAEVCGKRNFNQHVDAHIGKNFAAQIFTADHQRRGGGINYAHRVV